MTEHYDTLERENREREAELLARCGRVAQGPGRAGLCERLRHRSSESPAAALARVPLLRKSDLPALTRLRCLWRLVAGLRIVRRPHTSPGRSASPNPASRLARRAALFAAGFRPGDCSNTFSFI